MPDVQSVTVDSRGGDNNLLQIVLSLFGGRRFLDIRRYFRGGEGALIPTKKGICLSLNEFQFLVTAIHANESTIASWLEQGASEAWVELNRIRIAGEAARYEAKSFIRVSRPERTATFFSIAEEGGKLKLIYNESHPLRRAMEMAQVSAGTSGDPNRLIDILLVSYARCRERFDPDRKVEPAVLFEMLENEWGRGLRRYLEESES